MFENDNFPQGHTPETLTNGEDVDIWQSGSSYIQKGLQFPVSKFLAVTDLLIDKPNLNSTYLFRADILYDSAGLLLTPGQKERMLGASPQLPGNEGSDKQGILSVEDLLSDKVHSRLIIRQEEDRKSWPGFRLERTVIRRLIPRKPHLDVALVQHCLICSCQDDVQHQRRSRHLVIYYPDVSSEAETPWYHPSVKGLAYLYENEGGESALSIHFLPFSGSAPNIPPRLHRTLLSLLQTFIRLCKYDPPTGNTDDHPSTGKGSDPKKLNRSSTASFKDTILPQHIVQDTYSRLKQKYASDLIKRWVEKTEPAKHVFEDLSIAAFLTELWRQMYHEIPFPGFVDIACGNGVLVYILRQEGYEGNGFDARRRKTWEILGINEHLHEQICIPKPFIDALESDDKDQPISLGSRAIHNGIFAPDTFIISNHADELTPWTPILAALSSCSSSSPSSASPLPFLAIPCCSHALSGARHRYPPTTTRQKAPTCVPGEESEAQPASGDLRALRAAKLEESSHADDKSMYACLTRKVISLAEEVGCCGVQATLMRIPSTRNIGIVGNRLRYLHRQQQQQEDLEEEVGMLKLGMTAGNGGGDDGGSVSEKIERLVERECAVSGGVLGAARTWVERAQKLQSGKGRGKVNLGGAIDH